MAHMTAFDYAVLGIVGLSVIVSIWRGVVREVLALLSWVIAFVIAQGYAHSVAAWLPSGLASWRDAVVFVVLILVLLVRPEGILGRRIREDEL